MVTLLESCEPTFSSLDCFIVFRYFLHFVAGVEYFSTLAFLSSIFSRGRYYLLLLLVYLRRRTCSGGPILKPGRYW